MLYRLDISTFYFYEPLLFQMLVPWKFVKTSVFLSLSTITFTVNSHVNNYFDKYVYLLQIYCMKAVFLLKYTLMFFTALIFYSFSVDYVKTIELHVVHT